MLIRKILLPLVLAGLFLLIHAPFFDWWCETGIARFLSRIQPSSFNDVVVLVLAVLGCLLAGVLPSHLSETGNKWGRALFGCLLFMLLVETIGFNEFFIRFQALPWFRYSDMVIAVSFSFVVFSWLKALKERTKPINTDTDAQQLYYDDTDEPDFLEREERVEHICDFLSKNRGNGKGATGVAITGGWGTGKSWVLERVRKYMKSRKEICVDFKPWAYGETDITRQIYLALERELKTEGIRVSELKDAVLEIDKDETSGMGKALLSLMGVVTKTQGRENAINNIKKKLLKAGRQIYVFIDDCDRLAHDELLQVLSLIRNTGDFPLITYVMAFDERVVKKTLKDEDGIQYVAKMFNLTEVLTPVTDEIISDYLSQAVKSLLDEKGDFENPYSRISVTHYLPTVREAKKYLNLLKADYAHLKERFDKYFISSGDFCLIELVKYKYPDVYFGLMVNPKKYLKYERMGWNSPVGLPIEKAFEDDEDLMVLMKALFREVGSSRDAYGIIGVANKECFHLYFDRKTTNRYVDGTEFMESVNSGTLPQKIGGWLDENRSGVLGLLCAVHASLSRREAFLSMAEYIWHQCDKQEAVNTFNGLTYGYEKEGFKHGYKSIKDLIAETPQIHLLTFQHLPEPDSPDTQKNSVEKLIRESGRTLENMGIWLNELKFVETNDYPYDEIRYYVGILWKKLLSELADDTMSTLNVIDVWADSAFDDVFTSMILPMITENPQRWLGATITKLSDTQKDYYFIKERGVQAVFGRLSEMDNRMNRIVEEAKMENKDYVVAYANLIGRLKGLIVKEEDHRFVDRLGLIEGLEIGQLPALNDSVMMGIGLVMPMGAALKQLKQSVFWQGK